MVIAVARTIRGDKGWVLTVLGFGDNGSDIL
jgi:hypothetical protein